MHDSISEQCSKCPILIKEVGVVKDMQQKMDTKIDDIYQSLNGNLEKQGWLNRVEALERQVKMLDERLIILENKIDPTLIKIENKIDILLSKSIKE